jgi:hypothetical protein
MYFRVDSTTASTTPPPIRKEHVVIGTAPGRRARNEPVGDKQCQIKSDVAIQGELALPGGLFPAFA